MRKIAGPGHVSNAFVDYDAILNPDGTVYTADWGNDVQNELVGIQDEYSIAEAAGTNKYVLAAIKGVAIGFGKQIGELFFLDTEKDPAIFDKDAPEDFFPGMCLSTIEDFEDIDVANWVDLVAHLRAKAFKYFEGITGETSAFNVTDWAIVSNVATLTFSGAAATAMLAALAEDVLVHGSYTNWRSVTLDQAIGDITAAEYAITDVDAAGLTIDFAFTAGDNSGSVTADVNFYQHRVPGSTTTARLMEATARSLISANDADGEAIAGMRRRDRLQGHWTRAPYNSGAGGNTQFPTGTGWGLNSGGSNFAHNAPDSNNDLGILNDPVTDTVNGTPRTGTTTDPRALVGHLFIWGRTYIVP